MGRKVDMKKIENITKCQVTFSKRRSSLFKKAHEISVLCDVDVALVAFSPSGRLGKFCSRKRIEDVLERYIDLSPDKRYHRIKNLEKKLDMLRQLGHIKGDESKLHHLNNLIKHVEQKVHTSTIELELILKANLRNYEPNLECDPSLAQLLRCEKSLKNSLQRVLNRKRTLLANLSPSHETLFRVQRNQMRIGTQVCAPIAFENGGNELMNWATQNPTSSQLLLQLDPWISPYSSKTRKSILEDLLDQAKGKSVCRGLPGASDKNTSDIPMTAFPSIYQSGLLSTTSGTQIPSTSTYAPIQNHLNLQNGVDHNPNEKISWLNTTQKMNVNLPLPSKKPSSPLGCELFLGNAVAACSIASSSSNNNNKNCGFDAVEKLLAAHSRVHPLPESLANSFLPTKFSIEGTMGNVSNDTLMNSAANQEDCSWEFDGLAENLNLEDLEILL